MLHSHYPFVLGPEHSKNTETSRSNTVIVCRQVLKKTVSGKTSSRYIKMVFQHLDKCANSIKWKIKINKKKAMFRNRT